MILLNGDMLSQLKELEDNSVDSIVTDPPYHLSSIVKRFGPGQKGVKQKDGAAGAYSRASKGFMGKEWDGGDVAFRPETWEECWRVLKPGGHLLSFSSSRTYHRMAVAIEDAGYEIRDQVMWVYGSGFPKSHNIGKTYDKKRGQGAEKLIDPDFEMKHVVGQYYEHPDGRHFRLHPDISGEMSFGSQDGRYNRRKIYVEQFRKAVGVNPNSRPNPSNKNTATHDYGITSTTDIITVGDNPYEGWGTALKPSHEPICVARKPLSEKTVLANMEKWGVGGYNIDVSRVPNDGETFDHVAINKKELNYGVAGGPNLKPGGNEEAVKNLQDKGRWPANLIHDGSEEVVEHFPNSKGGHWPDSKTTGGGESWGGTSEYNGTGPKDKVDGSAARFFYVPKVGKKERNAGVETNIHPTVKPIALMEYLIKMVTPTGGVVLDPFMGSGSTGCAAVSNGYDFVGIEMEKDSFDIASKRIEHWGKS